MFFFTVELLAVAEEGIDATSSEMIVTDVIELSETMDNGRSYFEDRGTYVLLSVQSMLIFFTMYKSFLAFCRKG